MPKDEFVILSLPGDGIGPEVAVEAKRVIDFYSERKLFRARWEEGLIGGAAWQAEGTALSDQTVARARQADAILLGAVGGPQFDDLPRDLRPEAGLLRIRKDLDFYANLRPITCFPAMASASTLKADIVAGLDVLIVRELSSGVYFGTPRGVGEKDGLRYCVDTQYYSENEIIRIARVAFERARERNGLVHSVDKANVMETGHFWREVVTTLHQQEYPDIVLKHMYADNCAMQLVRNPKQFDVIVTDNLFGDILSDCAAMLTGSLGMLPSASLGAARASGGRIALYEPVHGSAPDITGQGKANPIAMLLSLAMLFRISFNRDDLASVIEQAVEKTLLAGARTADLIHDKAETEKESVAVSTSEMTSAILAQMDVLLQEKNSEEIIS